MYSRIKGQIEIVRSEKGIEPPREGARSLITR